MAIKFLNSVAVDTDVLYVNATNNRVGIGTTSPSTDFHVNGHALLSNSKELRWVDSTGAQEPILKLSSSNLLSLTAPDRIRIVPDGHAAIDIFSGHNTKYTMSSVHSFQDNNGDTALRITASGNVGITDTTPGRQLTLGGAAPVLSLHSTSTTGESSIYFGDPNDDNEGRIIYSNSQDAMQIWTAAGEKMRVTSTGNVGIGTTNPNSILHISDANPEFILEDTTNLNRCRIKNVDGNLRFEADYNSQLGNSRHLFFIDGSEKLRINTDGNVGIGTTSPSKKLDVGSTSSDYVAAFRHSTATGYAPGSILLEAGEGIRRGQGIYHYNNVADENWFTGVPYSVSSKKWIVANKYSTSQDVSTAQLTHALMTIDSETGNVGIGTTSPASTLHLKSNTSTLTLESSDTGLDPDQVWASLDFKQNDASQTPVGSVANISAIAKAGNTNFGNLLFQTKPRPADAYNDTLFLSSSGNVGIGTTSPSAKLHVAGNILLDSTLDTGAIILSGSPAGQGGQVRYISGAATTNDFWFNVPTNGRYRFAVADSQKVEITAAGNVGIGTTAPTAKLQIDSTSGWGVFTERGIKDGLTSTYSHNYSAGNAHILGRTIYFESAAVFSTSTADATTKEYRFSNASDKLTVKSLVAGNTVDDNILVLSGSNVGIGTASPARTLDVAGRGRFVDSTGTVDICSSTYVPLLITNTNGYAHARINGFEVGGNTTANNEGYIKTSDNSRKLILDTNGWRFLAQNAEFMRIASSGNVGIGTTSPDYPLHVDATIKIGDRQGTDGSLILQSQQGPNITFKSTGDVLDISGTTGATNGNSIRLSDNIKKLYFNGGIGGTIAINRGNRGLMDSNVGGLEVQQQDTASSNGKSTFLSTSSSGTILRSTSYGGTGTSGDIQFQFGGGSNTSEPSPTTKMVIKNSGNVGIGATSPLNRLQVTGGSVGIDSEYMIRDNRNNTILLQSASTAASNRSLTIGNATYSNIIVPNGNVGIGTTSPQHILDVADSGINSTAPTIRLTNTANYNAGSWGGNTSHSIEFYSSDPSGSRVASAIENIAGIDKGGLLTGNLVFKTADYPTPGILTEKMRIAEDGNVGIGTTSPATKLHVLGESIRTGVDASNYVDISSTSTSTSFSTVGNGIIAPDIIFNINTTNRLTIDGTTGNVGIGTATPSEKLEVDGNVQAETLIATDLTDGYVPWSRNGTVGLQDSEIYQDNGQVGIGTTTLSQALNVNGEVLADGYRLSAMQTAPSSKGDTGTLGEIRITADYIYVCYAANSWRRVALAAW